MLRQKNILLTLFIPVLFMSFQSLGQIVRRDQKENETEFLNRVSEGNYLKDHVVTSGFNTPGEKIIYFYHRMDQNNTGTGKDSIKTIRMVILIPDTVNPLIYESFDLELDIDATGYGLGIESAEVIKTKKEKSLNIIVFHLMPGPGRTRVKAYENFTLKQKSNNSGFFNDFELKRIR
jgi:hypothetical protein